MTMVEYAKKQAEEMTLARSTRRLHERVKCMFHMNKPCVEAGIHTHAHRCVIAAHKRISISTPIKRM